MMGYLNNVEAGGATAFCKPFKEEIIQPRKGSITFWYSLGNEIHAYVIFIFRAIFDLSNKIALLILLRMFALYVEKQKIEN